MTHRSGSVTIDGEALSASNLEARVGTRGHVKVRGSLPLKPRLLQPASARDGSSGRDPLLQPPPCMQLDVAGLELRVKNLYTGSVDASVSVKGATSAPVVGGSVRFSRGTAYLLPAGSSPQPGGQTVPEAAQTAAAAAASSSASVSEAELVSRGFAALKAGRLRAAERSTHQVSLAWFRVYIQGIGFGLDYLCMGLLGVCGVSCRCCSSAGSCCSCCCCCASLDRLVNEAELVSRGCAATKAGRLRAAERSTRCAWSGIWTSGLCSASVVRSFAQWGCLWCTWMSAAPPK